MLGNYHHSDFERSALLLKFADVLVKKCELYMVRGEFYPTQEFIEGIPFSEPVTRREISCLTEEGRHGYRLNIAEASISRKGIRLEVYSDLGNIVEVARAIIPDFGNVRIVM